MCHLSRCCICALGQLPFGTVLLACSYSFLFFWFVLDRFCHAFVFFPHCQNKRFVLSSSPTGGLINLAYLGKSLAVSVFLDHVVTLLYSIMLFAFNCLQSYLVNLFTYWCPHYFGHIQVVIFSLLQLDGAVCSNRCPHYVVHSHSVWCGILLLGLHYLVALF